MRYDAVKRMSRKGWILMIVVALLFASLGIRQFIRMRSATATNNMINDLRQTDETTKYWGLHTNSMATTTNASPTE